MRGRSAILALALALAAPAFSASKVIAVDVDGIIHPVTTEIVTAAITQAKQENAVLVLIRLNTPGGLMDAMRETIQQIVSSPVPVVTYVAPSGGRAASAGFFILESGDVAAMAPGTNTGAAHPVAMTGEMDAEMKEKVVNDAAAYMRSICTRRGRDAAVAETAVRQSKSFTEHEALDQHLVDLIAGNEGELLRALDGRTVTRFNGSTATLHTAGATIEVYQRSLRQKIISAIADPNIALILLVIGALAIYVEFSAPGMVAPGVIGSILVLLGLSALSVLPINWLGAALLLLAFALFALEAKVAAHGVLAVGGAVAMVLGAVMLVDSPLPEMRIHWGTAIALALPFSLITVLLLSLAVRARRNKVETGKEGMVGEIGAAYSALTPSGKVFVHGEYWNAVSAAPVAAGQRVRVTGIDGLTLTVEPAPDRTGD
ncbi:MAG TPA: nodulation protein NfeD [Candidatus Sulfopaludibacter sp.]|jgi:membrane-bound serine protease (ClpP class)|nr:nodulation protein NfeD [Candidatus Sulfopaludibacter sp.]